MRSNTNNGAFSLREALEGTAAKPRRRARGEWGWGPTNDKMMTLSSRDVPALVRLQQQALMVGVVALLAGFVGAAMNVDQFFRSWLIGFLFCLSLSLGSLALLMLQHLSGGQWGLVGRRVFEARVRAFVEEDRAGGHTSPSPTC